MKLLPAFPPKDMSSDEIDDFLGTVLESYVQEARFYDREIKIILLDHGRMHSRMSKEDKIDTIKDLLSE